MKLTIIIFNYNYHQFLKKLFQSLLYAFNHKDINIFFYDDGSDDGSLAFVENYLNEKKINNFTILSLSNLRSNGKRQFASGGQLDGVIKIFNECDSNINEYISFIDSDDWFNDNAIKNILEEISETSFDIYFNDLKDVNNYDNLPIDKREIKRKVINLKKKIWPTIIPTSGIVIKKEVLASYFNEVTNKSDEFSDVWLDSRINMLAINHSENVKYTDIIIYRFIHGSNDSLNFDIKRTFKKQLQASKYYNYIVKNKYSFSFRKKILEIIHG